MWKTLQLGWSMVVENLIHVSLNPSIKQEQNKIGTTEEAYH